MLDEGDTTTDHISTELSTKNKADKGSGLEVPTTPPTHTSIAEIVTAHQAKEDSDRLEAVRNMLEDLTSGTSSESFEEREARFLTQADTYRATEVPYVTEGTAMDSMKQAVQQAGVLLVGETHGTVANADVIYNLCKKLGIRRVAVEYPRELQACVDTWLSDGMLDFQAIEASPDGRITAEQLAVLRQLRTEGLLDEVICMDAADDGTEADRERDEAMGTNVLNSYDPERPILAIAGKYHADTITHEDDDAPNGVHEPFGYRLRLRIPDAPVVKLNYRSGQYHNYGPHDFEQPEQPDIPDVNSPLLMGSGGDYQLVIPNAAIATVPAPDTR